jgi:UDP-3-O-[3-hydroxymyristoyl] N-acetylglucosamine deacetylase
VTETARSTTIGIGDASVQTVEHLLAAIAAYNIDNVTIEISDGEPPIADGSAAPFVELIERAGIVELGSPSPILRLNAPIYISHKETHLVALPADEYRISYTLHYPKSAAIRSQYFSLSVNQESFKREISTCRTFALYEEITALMEKGLIRGGSLENAIVIKDDVILTKEGKLEFDDELVRHKVLDLIGDLSLVGIPFLAHIIAIRSGHTTNVALGKEIKAHLETLHNVGTCS